MAASSPEILGEQRRPATAVRDARHIDTLTGYRGLAALVVLLVHGAGHTAYPWIGLHGYGPIALFVLSGYLLITPWSRWSLGQGASPDLRTFTRRRLARIFPAYLVVLVVVALVYPASRPKDGTSWLRALTLTNFLGADGLRPAMEHTWSMGTEFSWYVALPVIGFGLALLGRRVWPRHASVPMYAVLGLSIATTVGWVVWVNRTAETLQAQLTFPLWLPAYLACFILGATVRHLELAARTPGSRQTWLPGLSRHAWAPALVAVAAAAVLVSDLSGPYGFYDTVTFGQRSTRTVAATVLAVSLLLVAVTAGPRSAFTRVLGTTPLVAVGRWSYGIYLWHLPVTIILVENIAVPGGPLGFVQWIGLILGVSAALGAFTYTFIEKPAIAWSKR